VRIGGLFWFWVLFQEKGVVRMQGEGELFGFGFVCTCWDRVCVCECELYLQTSTERHIIHPISLFF
jgi:hypothetical protein